MNTFFIYFQVIKIYKRKKIQNLSMEPQHIRSTRQLLRNIQCTQLNRYLTLAYQKQQLGYLQQCIPNPQNIEIYQQIIGIDCEMIDTNIGQQLVHAVIIKQDGTFLYDKWYHIIKGSQVSDYLTHITGITEDILNIKAKQGSAYSQADIQQIQHIIKNKIIVGHDLVNDINMLKIKHQAFIDTISLLPHNLGLPFKSKLRDLAAKHLKKHIQWDTHDPAQDALTALQLVRAHVDGGRGTIQIQPFPDKNYSSNQQILKDAQIDPKKLLLFVLRGSRALKIAVQTPQYKSDYDYVVVYNTACQINGRLIKLPNIDISFFDRISFRNYLIDNDISYLQLFFLPKQCVFINQFKQPQIFLQKLRVSLGFHLNKASMKYKRIVQAINKNQGYEWKALKTIHLKIRFMDVFLQIYELVFQKIERQQNNDKTASITNTSITDIQIDITRVSPLWFQVQKQFIQSKSFKQVLKKLQKQQKLVKAQINSKYPITKNLRYKGHETSSYQYKNRKSVKTNRVEQTQKDEKMEQQFGVIYDEIGYLDDNEQKFSVIVQKQKQYISQQNISVDNPAHNKIKTVEILRQRGLQVLDEFRILSKRHRIYHNLIQLHYLQSASFNSLPPRQCRGLIVDQHKNYQIVALPYYKFFDYNDSKYSQVNDLDLQSAKVYEKKDGSITFLYYYNNKWNVASSTVPDGTNSYCFGRKQTTTQFKQQFWKIFNQLKFKMPSVQDKNKTFIFEIMSRNHIIVVKRADNDLCLHGVRNIETLQEQDHTIYEQKYNWKVTKPLDIKFNDIEQLAVLASKLDPLQSQGYVVCDKYWTRVKVKSADYVRINWLGQLNQGFNKNPKKYILIEIVLSGQADSFMKYCPEWQKLIIEYLQKIKRLNSQVLQIYTDINKLCRKQFAQQVSKYSKDFQSFLFAIRGNQKMFYGQVEHILNPKKFYTFITQY